MLILHDAAPINFFTANLNKKCLTNWHLPSSLVQQRLTLPLKRSPNIQAKQESSAYAQDVRGTILRSQYGLCWRTGYWTQGDAVIGCDGQLEPPVAKATAPAIATPVAGAPAAANHPERRGLDGSETN